MAQAPPQSPGTGEVDLSDFWAVVPAGGSGTRLWPLSRQGLPKFLLDLTGHGHSLLAETLTRLHPLCGPRLLIVTGQAHAESVRHSLPSSAQDAVLVEPCGRDSLPAIALAAATLERHHPDAILGSFAADHVITDHERFTRCVERAVHVAHDDVLVTLGVQPTYAATGFGYLAPGAPYRHERHRGARQVSAFIEKPGPERAAEYLRAGALWNAGMFVCRVRVLMSMVERWQPDLARAVRRVACDPGTITDVWPQLSAQSIDRAIAEPAAREGLVVVVPADFDWDDIGDFASLALQSPAHPEHPDMRVLGDPSSVLSFDSSGFVAARGQRPVVTLGVSDVVVIDTDDVVLVTTREHAQDVRQIVQALRACGRQDLT